MSENPPNEYPPFSPNSDAPQGELLGANDIVEAFTALRHELKLQVRSGREMQQTLSQSLERLEEHLAAPSAAAVAAVPLANEVASEEQLRKMAEAIADVEEALDRAVGSLMPLVPSPRAAAPDPGANIRRLVAQAPWWARMLCHGLLQQIQQSAGESSEQAEQTGKLLSATHQGLQLLLERVRRSMQQCDIARVDVLHQMFDAETMHAIDQIETADVPSAHVAQQLSPAYIWRGKILRCAQVRLAR